MKFNTIVVRPAVTVLAAAAIGLASSASASAATYPYCGVLVPPNTACGHTVGGTSIYINVASYTGSGSVGVCERVITAENGNTVSRRCAVNIVGSGTDLNPYPVAYKIASVGNDSNYAHTIHGTVYY